MPKILPSTYCPDFHNVGLVEKMKYNPFGETGLKVSHLGFGSSQLALCLDTPEEEEGIEAVVAAVRSGINYIDTAPFYGEGKAEIVLGKALRLLPRETYYIATKVGRYTINNPTMFDFSASRTLKSVEESLARLGVNYVDVIQVHDLEFAPDLNIILNETLPALQKVKDSGKAKFIGITGYPIKKLKQILESSTVKIDVILSYSRCTLFDDALKEYIPYFKEKGVGIINAAPLGMGMLTDSGPPAWHPVKRSLKTACYQATQYCQGKKVDIAKLATYYSLSQPSIDTHLIGMPNRNVLKKNLDVVWNGLTLEESQVLQEVKEKYFKHLSETNWEDVELKEYWKTMCHDNSK